MASYVEQALILWHVGKSTMSMKKSKGEEEDGEYVLIVKYDTSHALVCPFVQFDSNPICRYYVAVDEAPCIIGTCSAKYKPFKTNLRVSGLGYINYAFPYTVSISNLRNCDIKAYMEPNHFTRFLDLLCQVFCPEKQHNIHNADSNINCIHCQEKEERYYDENRIKKWQEACFLSIYKN